MKRTFNTPEQLIMDLEPRFVQGPNGTTDTLYDGDEVVKLAKAYAKDMAIQVLFEADGGFDEHGKGFVPQKVFAQVLKFINEQ